MGGVLQVCGLRTLGGASEHGTRDGGHFSMPRAALGYFWTDAHATCKGHSSQLGIDSFKMENLCRVKLINPKEAPPCCYWGALLNELG